MKIFFGFILLFSLAAQSVAAQSLDYCVSVKKYGYAHSQGYDIFCNEELVETIVGSVEGVKSKYETLFEYSKSFFSENIILFSNDERFSESYKMCMMAENRFRSGVILDYLPGLKSTEHILQRVDCGFGTIDPFELSGEEVIAQSLENNDYKVSPLFPFSEEERSRFKQNISLRNELNGFMGLDLLNLYY